MWWHLWPKITFKTVQEFPTVSLDFTQFIFCNLIRFILWIFFTIVVILCKMLSPTESLDKFTIVFILCNILSLTHSLDKFTNVFVWCKILSLTLGKIYHFVCLMQLLFTFLLFFFSNYWAGLTFLFILEHLIGSKSVVTNIDVVGNITNKIM